MTERNNSDFLYRTVVFTMKVWTYYAALFYSENTPM